MTVAARADDGERWQSPASIRETAREAALLALGGDESVRLEAVGVDERVKLARCGGELEASIEQPLRNGRGTVAVRCAGPDPWRLFVPVRGSRDVAVVVARHGIQRGQVLGAADVELAPRSSASLPYDYLLRVEDAVGHTVRRAVPAGAVLVPAALERPRLVERGALVTLVAAGGAVLVKSQGVALEPAAANERVRVRTASGRVVEGIVEATGEVRVGS